MRVTSWATDLRIFRAQANPPKPAPMTMTCLLGRWSPNCITMSEGYVKFAVSGRRESDPRIQLGKLMFYH